MYPKIDQNQKTDMFYLTRNHYLQEKQLEYNPTKKSIFSYFENHSHPCYLSLMYQSTPAFDVTNKQSLIQKKLIS